MWPAACRWDRCLRGYEAAALDGVEDEDVELELDELELDELELDELELDELELDELELDELEPLELADEAESLPLAESPLFEDSDDDVDVSEPDDRESVR